MRRSKQIILSLLVVTSLSLCYILSDYSSAIADNDIMYENNSTYQSYKFKESNIMNYSLKEDGDIKLSENFNVNEFRCLDGSEEILIDLELVNVLQSLRDYFNKPVYINSAYRTKEHNKKIGGSENSYNLYGRGIDFYVEGIPNKVVASYAEYIGIKGIIIFSDSEYSLHIDTRDEIWYKYYSHDNDEYSDVGQLKDGRFFDGIEVEQLGFGEYGEDGIG